MELTGFAYKFGDNISTDLIISGRYKFFTENEEELARHVMEDADPQFYNKIRSKNVFIVGGENFGTGSSREQAPLAIKYANVKAVIAKSFAHIFYRNSFNIGLPLVECNTELIRQGDELKLSLKKGKLENITQGREINIKPLSPIMMELLKSGGIVAYFKKHKGLIFKAKFDN